MKYWITVTLEMSDEVEANSPQEAFEILSEAAMSGGSWDWYYEEIEEDD